MPTIYTAAALAVAALYCVWRARVEAGVRRHRQLCRRVAYMLWVAAADDTGTPCRAEVNYGYDEE
jgi:hypothetical protein